MCIDKKNNNNENKFVTKRYFTACIAFSSSITTETFHKVTRELDLQIAFS